MKIYNSLALALVVAVLASCAPGLQTRLETVRELSGANFQEIVLATSQFDLFVLATPVDDDDSLTIFIEGDGYAWRRRKLPSKDPTPITQIVATLASTHESGNAAYLARPCQFVGSNSRNCDVSLWTDARYSEAVVAALDEAVSYLRARQPAQTLRLVGYSGGGTLAALLAARRTDVTSLVTIAAMLDTDAFASHHKTAPLITSLNPVDFVDALASIPQVHLVGEDDDTIPKEIVLSFVRALPTQNCTQVRIVPDTTHMAGWLELRPSPGNVVTQCENRP